MFPESSIPEGSSGRTSRQAVEGTGGRLASLLEHRQVLVGSVACGLVVLLGVWWTAGRIGSSLYQSAHRVIEEAGVRGVGVQIDGRNVTLLGDVRSEEMRRSLAERIERIAGVARVDNRLTIRTTPLPRFVLQPDGDQWIVGGLVPAESTRELLVDLARRFFGEDRVRDEIVVGTSDSMPWLSALLPILESFARVQRDVGRVGFEVGEEGIVLRGTVQDRTRSAELELLFSAALQRMRIDNQIRVGGPQSLIDDIMRDRSIEFESGSATMTPAGRALVVRIRDVLARFPDARVEVAGHTDSVGDPGLNRDLSHRRARSVVAVLAETLDAERFVPVGFGADSPIADNRTSEGRRQNRRIEFRVLEERRP